MRFQRFCTKILFQLKNNSTQVWNHVNGTVRPKNVIFVLIYLYVVPNLHGFLLWSEQEDILRNVCVLFRYFVHKMENQPANLLQNIFYCVFNNFWVYYPFKKVYRVSLDVIDLKLWGLFGSLIISAQWPVAVCGGLSSHDMQNHPHLLRSGIKSLKENKRAVYQSLRTVPDPQVKYGPSA